VVNPSLADRVRSLKLPDEDELRSRGMMQRLATSSLWIVLLVGGLGCGYYALKNGWLPKLTGELKVTRSTESPPPASSQPVARKAPAAAPIATAGTAARTSQAVASARSIPVAAAGAVVLEAKGYIIPEHQILVSPLVNGRIMSLSIEEGRRVEAGAILAELETTEYAADVARAKAILAAAQARLAELERGNRPEEIAAAKAELNEAEAQRQQLLSDWKRKTQLRESRVLTEGEYEQAEYQFKAMDKRVERLKNAYRLMVEGPRVERIHVAKAEVMQAEADLKRSQWRLENCTIRAPISGTILKKNAEEGNIVNPIAFNGSFSLCEMADLSDLEVELFIQERDISRVAKGQRCKVRAEAYPDREYDGVVSRLMPIADRAKGAVPVRVKLTVPAEEEGVYLKPEMGAVVSFLKSSE
jgi:multidrug resistance efflux pump